MQQVIVEKLLLSREEVDDGDLGLNPGQRKDHSFGGGVVTPDRG